ncbi:ComF family protein [Sulfuricystis thermophila]|uniref:ComF family protein n=1 Tax=Sulfuricystis thermophila TaxID=2496847 RepID=UPI0024DF993E|nr:ComF family protein [Sulfuricystis thermophila]
MTLKALLTPWLDQLLPRACLLCGAHSHTPVCEDCTADLPRLGGALCPVCATPLGVPASACGTCLKSPPAYDATFAPLRYAFPVDALVHQLKYGCRLASADFFSRFMLAGPRPEVDLLMPVPLSRQRLRERGFNQALEIARPLARALGLPIDATSLYRQRDTLPQSRLPWRERQGNVRHAFACSRNLAGLTVIVVDDVMTTGATLAAVATTLKAQGAARIVNWAATRAVSRGPA